MLLTEQRFLGIAGMRIKEMQKLMKILWWNYHKTHDRRCVAINIAITMSSIPQPKDGAKTFKKAGVNQKGTAKELCWLHWQY